MRGGCVCSGTYGHFLLNVSKKQSQRITELINKGDFSEKPGWVRWSLHPTTTNAEVEYIANALAEIAEKGQDWQTNYTYSKQTNEFSNKNPEAAALWKNVEEHFNL